MKRISRFFYVFLFLMLFIGISVIAEEITLTTYYPAPYGSYEELEVETLHVEDLSVDRLGIGTPNPRAALHVQS